MPVDNDHDPSVHNELVEAISRNSFFFRHLTGARKTGILLPLPL